MSQKAKKEAIKDYEEKLERERAELAAEEAAKAAEGASTLDEAEAPTMEESMLALVTDWAAALKSSPSSSASPRKLLFLGPFALGVLPDPKADRAKAPHFYHLDSCVLVVHPEV